MEQLCKNKYVLYAVLLIAITNVLGYLTIQDYNSLVMFIAIGVLSTYFSKNMIVNLGSAIVFTNLFFAKNVLEGLTVREGAQNNTETDTDKDAEPAPETNTKKPTKKPVDDNCPEGHHMKSGLCVKNKEQFSQRNVPSSQPAPASESMDDQEIGKRVDYAATLEQAYDNLQNMLGGQGMEGLTKETQKLISQQSSLMKTLNTMSPVLNNAQSTLQKFDIGSMTKSLDTLKGFMGNKNTPK